MLTAPQFASPIILTTTYKYPPQESIAQLQESVKNRFWNGSLHVHTSELPQIHVAPTYIEEPIYCFVPTHLTKDSFQ